MIIKKIKANNFLTFDENFEFEPDKNLTIIVGPNGAGKTNIFRLLEFVGNYFNLIQKRNNLDLMSFIHDYIRDPENGFSVEVTVSLSDDEMKILNDYLVFSLINEAIHSSPPQNNKKNPYIEEEILKTKIYKMLAEYGSNFIGNLSNEFTFRIRRAKYENSPLEFDLIFKFNENNKNVFYKGYMEDIRIQDQNSRIIGSRNLIGLIKDELNKNFFTNIKSFEEILSNNEFLQGSFKIFIGPSLNLNFDNFSHEFNIIINGFDMQINNGNIEDNVKKTFLNAKNDFLNIKNKLLNMLDELINKIRSKGYYDENLYLDDFFITLYNSSIIILKNPRPPPEDFTLKSNVIEKVENNTSLKQNVSTVIPFIETIKGSEVTEKLFNLSNSKDYKNRKIWHDFVDDVYKITGMKPYLYTQRKNVLNNENKPIVKIAFETEESSKESKESIQRVLSLEFAPAGAIEILSIFASIAVSSGKILLLDEPAQNLHPPLQRKLYKYLKDFIEDYKTQVIMITHSPYMIDPLEIKNVGIVREDDKQISKITHLNEDFYKKTVEKWFVKQSKLLASLFADIVILTEGDGEEIALEVWFENIEKNEKLTPEKKDKIGGKEVQILNVFGQNNFENYGSILEKYGIKFYIFCDNKAMKEKYVEEHNEIVVKTGNYNDFSHYLCNEFHEIYSEAVGDPNLKCPGENSNEDFNKYKKPETISRVANKTIKNPPSVFNELIDKILDIKKNLG